jgi:hypothetical protein
VVTEADVTKLVVVLDDGFHQTNNSRVVLIMRIPFNKPSVELDDHGEGDLFASRIIEASGGLDQLMLVSMAFS